MRLVYSREGKHSSSKLEAPDANDDAEPQTPLARLSHQMADHLSYQMANMLTGAGLKAALPDEAR